MLKQTKNGLFTMITARFDASRFEREEYEDATTGSVFIIRLKGTGLEFRLFTSRESHFLFQSRYTLFTPDFRYSNDVFLYNVSSWTSDFEYVRGRLDSWMQQVEAYLQEEATVDLWSVLDDERLLFGTGGMDVASLTAFTEEEKSRTRKTIAEFERQIHTTFRPNAEQAQVIAAQLKYLSDAVDRLNHFDWRSLLLSTVIGISTTLSLDTETGRQLFEMAKQIFAGALKYLPG